MQLGYTRTNLWYYPPKVSLSNHFHLIASIWTIILSVRSVSAQETIPTPVSTSGFGQTTGVGVVVFSSLFSAIFVIAVIVIIIGVIRSRRDPERYGPQQARPGRPKQSRAKGLARAVIESIPIVRFGENNANVAAQRDIELAVTGLANRSQSATVNANNTSIDPDTIAVTSGTSTNIPATAEGGLSTTEPIIQTRPGSLECSICLDDFVQREEIRALPCSHRFHPACIDPWLLNISGTCPIYGRP